MKITTVVCSAAALRFILIAYGEWHDTHLEVPYTDVDYTVFSDAAGFIAKGQSPYLRATYRYSPLIALLLLPNVWFLHWWGKLLFSIADVLAGCLIYDVLRKQNVKEEKCTLCAALWLFNPFTFTVATRGNSEAISCAIVLWLLHCVLNGRIFEAACWYGLVVHLRIYPIIYALPLVLFIGSNHAGVTKSRFFNWPNILFGSISASVFFALTVVSYWCYGDKFLNEALIYHLTRTDPRHNFSFYFYSIYLHQDSSFTIVERLQSFLPQMLIQTLFAFAYSQHLLPFCLFVQTVAFVAFNKVVTAQYFVWFFCLLPLVIGTDSVNLSWRKAAVCLLIWVAAQLHWLGWAYLLEFKGKNVFLQLWFASIIFFLSNIVVLAIMVKNCAARP